MEKRLEIILDDKTFPFFNTIRSRVMFSRSEFTSEDLVKGNMDAIIYSAFCITMGACLRERIPFPYEYETFIDVCPDNIIETILKLDGNNIENKTSEIPQKKMNRKK